jgi:riboflavin synthase
VGASVSVAGVCLTVTALHDSAADFDVMQQTLAVTTLGALQRGSTVNVERAARDGAEVGGHVLSGHVDAQARVVSVRKPENNRVLRLELPAPWMRYVFAKGYIAVEGASLTVAEAQRGRDGAGWFEVWLIPETLRVTTFGALREGDAVNVEIERQTQVIVDTVRAAVDERLGPLLPALEAFAHERGIAHD